jgi:mannan endo-1,4-beta-mannosidase
MKARGLASIAGPLVFVIAVGVIVSGAAGTSGNKGGKQPGEVGAVVAVPSTPGSAGGAIAAKTPTTVAALVNPRQPYVGVSLPAQFDSALDKFTSATGVSPNMYCFFKNWTIHSRFDGTEYRRAHARGVVPLIAWEPWDPRGPMASQPDYSLQSIIEGRHDELLIEWAQGIRDLEFPVAIRFAHEMNGHWYPWATTVNGNSPRQYVQAWRHVHGVFAAQGATNVAWVWSPNVNRHLPGRPLRSMYPGDRYVDLVGIVGYGVKRGDTFNSVFGSTIKEIRTFTRRSLLITETAGAQSTGSKAKWTRAFYRDLAKRRDIVGAVWFNHIKRVDWRVDADPQMRRVFGEAVRNYQATWRPLKTPRIGPMQL